MEQIVLYIGRDKSNDIVIDNQSISRQHASVTFINGEYRIQDNKSLNGVFINGHKVDTAIITSSDRITLGTSELLDWTKITKAIDSKRNSSESNQAGDGQIIAVYTISIGRSESNDIVLSNPGVSRQHASIISKVYPNKQSFEIRDNDSQNGTFVNGERITNKLIMPSDKITLGAKTELSWDLIAATITQKMGTINQIPKPQETDIRPNIAPIYIPETAVYEEYREQPQKRQGSAGWLVAGIVGGLILIIGVVLLIGVGRGSSPSQGSLLAEQGQHINISSKYYLKPGEPQDIAKRRAKIEAQREILERAKDSFPNSNSFATNYAIFSPEVTNQSYIEDEQAFITDISTQMSAPDFQTKTDYINTHQDIYDRLEALQVEYDANYSLVGEAESNMIQSYQTYQESIDTQSPPSFEYNQGVSSPSVEQYYNDCVSTYLEQVEMTEKTISDLSEHAATLNQIPNSALFDYQDPRDIYVSAVNGNWSTKKELLDMFEDNSNDDSSKDTMSDILDGLLEKDDILYQLYHDLLGCFVQEGERIVLSKNDLSVSYLNNDLASVSFTNEACSRLSLSIEFQDSTPQEIRSYLNKNYNGLQDKYEGSLSNLNQSMINYLKEPKYIVRDKGKWRLSIWDETLKE